MAELTEAKKQEIDALTYEELLRMHRFIPCGDARYLGEEGLYRVKRMAELRDRDPAAAVRASKKVGW